MATLKYIKTRTAAPDLRNFPDFLILGPQRTGTTWLQFNLFLHPEVRMNRLKEVYYFSTLGQPEHSHYRYDYLEDYLASFEESFKEKLGKHYTCLRKSFSFYHPEITGEATASYSILPEEIITEIVSLKPDIKGIIMLRDPIERAWSHAKKVLIRDKAGNEPVPFEVYREFFQREGQRQKADYPTMIETWKRHLAPGNLYLGLYNRIESDPAGILHDVEKFLGVTTKALFLNRHLTIRLNPTPEVDMPDDVKTFLEEFFRKDTETYQSLVASLKAS